VVSRYPNGTSTNIETNVYPTSATFSIPVGIGTNLIQDFYINAPGPTETDIAYNVSSTVIGGTTLISPAAAYIYNTVKVITAAPVTDTKGNVICGTPWSFPTTSLEWGGTTTKTITQTFGTETFANINSNAQAYWGSDIAGLSSSSGTPVIKTNTLYTTFSGTTPEGSPSVVIQTNTPDFSFYVNSKLKSVDTNPTQAGIVIKLETPYVYAPATAAAGATGDGHNQVYKLSLPSFTFKFIRTAYSTPYY